MKPGGTFIFIYIIYTKIKPGGMYIYCRTRTKPSGTCTLTYIYCRTRIKPSGTCILIYLYMAELGLNLAARV